MRRKLIAKFRRRIEQKGALAAVGAPHVKPAVQMRVTLDERGKPTLKPFPPDVRWMVRSYGD